MTNLEISKALALAIGWKEDDFMFGGDECVIDQGDDFRGYPNWREFDYRDWNVIGPIAERYDCFPTKSDVHEGMWFKLDTLDCTPPIYADTPQKAIALAVIEGAKK
jgi:hypothetical protein